MPQTRVAACLGVAALGTSSALGVTFQLTWQVSVNGLAYAPWAAAHPGDVVRLRLRGTLTGNTGEGSIGGSGGLASFNVLPTITNFRPDDVASPLDSEQFRDGSAENPFPGVIHHPHLGTITNVYQGVPSTFHGPGKVAGTGRHSPFGANDTNGAGVATPSVDAGTLSWRSSSIGVVGVSLSQSSMNNSGIFAITGVDDVGTPNDTSDDGLTMQTVGSFASNARSNLFLFTYEFRCGEADASGESMIAGCSVVSPVRWYVNGAGQSVTVPNVAVTSAVVFRVSPSPGGVALLGLAGVLASRRRR